MAKDIARIALLLAVFVSTTAHGAALINTSSIGNAEPAQDVLASLEDTETIKSNVTRKLSVVQDWSLVCKELCGAGLGGALCASACEDISVPEEDAESILEPNREAVCFDLCTFGLGDTICNCSSFEQVEKSKHQTNVCSAFCLHNNKTLKGCSDCIVEKNGNQATDPTTPDWDELCITLCKTGDGGVLCNCDLPPLL